MHPTRYEVTNEVNNGKEYLQPLHPLLSILQMCIEYKQVNVFYINFRITVCKWACGDIAV